MTVKEIVEKMDSFSDAKRVKYLAPLYESLTPISQKQITIFQATWDHTKSFGEFKRAQGVELRKCIEIELSEIGRLVREAAGLQPLNEDDEIKEPEKTAK